MPTGPSSSGRPYPGGHTWSVPLCIFRALGMPWWFLPPSTFRRRRSGRGPRAATFWSMGPITCCGRPGSPGPETTFESPGAPTSCSFGSGVPPRVLSVGNRRARPSSSRGGCFRPPTASAAVLRPSPRSCEPSSCERAQRFRGRFSPGLPSARQVASLTLWWPGSGGACAGWGPQTARSKRSAVWATGFLETNAPWYPDSP